METPDPKVVVPFKLRLFAADAAAVAGFAKVIDPEVGRTDPEAKLNVVVPVPAAVNEMSPEYPDIFPVTENVPPPARAECKFSGPLPVIGAGRVMVAPVALLCAKEPPPAPTAMLRFAPRFIAVAAL
jgi:hypothetical protein